METKNLENQNSTVQNVETVKNENDKSVLKEDNSKAEKTGRQKKAGKKQISADLKAVILEMIQSKAKESPKKNINVSTENHQEDKLSKAQISKTDKKLILSLVRDTNKNQAVYNDDELKQEEIDYEHLNKQELVEALEDIVAEKDVSQIKDQVGRIKVAFHNLNREEIEDKKQEFIAAGGDPENFVASPDPLEVRFNNAFSIYKHNKAKYSEELEKKKVENLKEKQLILDDLKELINSGDSLKATYDRFQELQEKWKQIGMVPASEYNNLWKNYHFLVEMFFDKVRINKELRDLDLKKNLEKKIELCEKTEALLNEESIIKSFKLLQKYHNDWREIGQIPREMNEEIWERFKNATDKINERRRLHYSELQEKQLENLKEKEALCDKIETFLQETKYSSIREWDKATKEMEELMKTWKTIGRAPKQSNDEIWNRFKGSLDKFYELKRNFFAELKKQQVENYQLKVKICEKAESLQNSTAWKNTTNELINLQKEWKNIGPVPRKYSDKIWKRFRSACDTFFNNKSEHFQSLKNEEKENLEKKVALIERIKNFKPLNSKEENINAIKDFQKEWQNIGHVIFKEKDRIYHEYKEAIQFILNKLSLSLDDVNASNFIKKVEGLKSSPEGERQLIKEKNVLKNKMKKLQDEVTLWENNIGFFSNSKQSNAFKEEFEKKIEKAKSELKSIKDKIKLINKELES